MTVSEQIIQVLDALGEKMGIAIDWTSQNVLPVAQQICERYIRYEIVMSILWMVLELVSTVGLIVGGIKLFKFLIKAKQNPLYERNCCVWADMTMVLSAIGIAILGIVLVVGFVWDFETLCKCLLLPELHIFEEFSNLLK